MTALPGVLSLHPVAAEDSAPMYVDANAIKERFSTITDADMDMLRSKKILLLSQSFGLNTVSGLQLLAKEDKKYDLLSSFLRGTVPDFSNTPTTAPAANAHWPPLTPDAFAQHNFVHCMITIWPFTKRVDELDSLMRTPSFSWGKTVDVAMIYYHTGPTPAEFEYYSKKMDALQADFPNVRFIYCASGVSGPKFADRNEKSFAFSELVRARYKGKAPLFDMGEILSDDYRLGHVFLPEYSNDPAQLHPNLPAGEMALAKGFLLVLRDALRAPWPPKNPVMPSTGEIVAPKVETLPADHPDYKAVRAILDANGLTDVKVEGVSAVENGRITKLFIKEIGVEKLTSDIGTLTELKVLHLYGDKKQSLPLLKSIDPAIGNCTKLEELLLNDNDLTSLPDSIANLKNIQICSLANNRLQNLSPQVQEWASHVDPKGMGMQGPASK
jgi:hypothetical protein